MLFSIINKFLVLPLSALLIYNPLKQWIWIFHAICAHQARTRQWKQHGMFPFEREIFTLIQSPIEMFSRNQYLPTYEDVTAHRLLECIAISHHAFLSCLHITYIGLEPTWEYDQRKRNAYIHRCNADRELAALSVSMTFYIWFNRRMCVYVCKRRIRRR